MTKIKVKSSTDTKKKTVKKVSTTTKSTKKTSTSMKTKSSKRKKDMSALIEKQAEIKKQTNSSKELAKDAILVEKLPEKKLKKFEKLLTTERDKILEKLNSNKVKYGELQKSEIGDMADRAFTLWELNRAIDVTEVEKKQLSQIQDALGRIETGEYGFCVCKKSISEKRLEAIPWTRLCVDCVKKYK